MRRLARLMGLLLLTLVPLIGGAAAGDWLRRDPPAADDATAAEGAEAAAGSADAAADDPGPSGETVSFRFPQQFFVPLVRGGTMEAVMILTLALEMPPAEQERIHSQENRLRDILLRTLFIHANAGGFDGNFTSAAHLDLLQGALLSSVRGVAGGAIHRVLIGDIARQDA